MTTEKQMAQLVCRALDEKKGRDIKVIDIHDVSVIADYFVIASGSNQNQVQAMVDNVEEQLGRAGFEPKQVEGVRNSSWILMDYSSVVINIFLQEARELYALERLWSDAQTVDLSQYLKKGEDDPA